MHVSTEVRLMLRGWNELISWWHDVQDAIVLLPFQGVAMRMEGESFPETSINEWILPFIDS